MGSGWQPPTKRAPQAERDREACRILVGRYLRLAHAMRYPYSVWTLEHPDYFNLSYMQSMTAKLERRILCDLEAHPPADLRYPEERVRAAVLLAVQTGTSLRKALRRVEADWAVSTRICQPGGGG